MSGLGESAGNNLYDGEQQFTNLLSGIGNHEAKLTLTAIMASQPDIWFRGADLFHEVKDRQGDHPGWIPERKNPISFCIESLAPVGLVAKGSVATTRGEVTAFKTNDDELDAVEQGYAMSGALLEWSLDHSEISVQKGLGVTAKKGAYRTPELRYDIIRTLVKQGGDLTHHEVTDALDSPNFTVDEVRKNIVELSRYDFLTNWTFDGARDATLEIVRPEFWHPGLELTELKHESQVVYHALQRLWDTGKREIHLHDLLGEAASIDSTIDLNSLRRYWHQGASDTAENMPGLRLAARTYEPGKFSSAAINPAHRDALVDFIHRLEAVRLDPGSWKSFQKTAKQIIDNPGKMAAIYAKAKHFSAAASGSSDGGESTNASIVDLLRQNGAMNTGEIHAALERQGRKLTKEMIYRYLGKLVKAEELSSDTRREDPSRKRQIKYYFLPEADTNPTPEN